jgi:hypothetical protein
VTQYTCEITFNGDPGFVASVPQTKGPASLEALPPRTFIHKLNFGYFLMYLQKDQKKKKSISKYFYD